MTILKKKSLNVSRFLRLYNKSADWTLSACHTVSFSSFPVVSASESEKKNPSDWIFPFDFSVITRGRGVLSPIGDQFSTTIPTVQVVGRNSQHRISPKKESFLQGNLLRIVHRSMSASIAMVIHRRPNGPNRKHDAETITYTALHETSPFHIVMTTVRVIKHALLLNEFFFWSQTCCRPFRNYIKNKKWDLFESISG